MSKLFGHGGHEVFRGFAEEHLLQVQHQPNVTKPKQKVLILIEKEVATIRSKLSMESEKNTQFPTNKNSMLEHAFPSL